MKKIDYDNYNMQINNYNRNIKHLENNINEIKQKQNSIKLKKYRLEEIKEFLEKNTDTEFFNEKIYQNIIDKIIISYDRQIQFIFKTGFTISKNIKDYK